MFDIVSMHQFGVDSLFSIDVPQNDLIFFLFILYSTFKTMLAETVLHGYQPGVVPIPTYTIFTTRAEHNLRKLLSLKFKKTYV